MIVVMRWLEDLKVEVCSNFRVLDVCEFFVLFKEGVGEFKLNFEGIEDG